MRAATRKLWHWIKRGQEIPLHILSERVERRAKRKRQQHRVPGIDPGPPSNRHTRRAEARRLELRKREIEREARRQRMKRR
jgi:hypothetical protein